MQINFYNLIKDIRVELSSEFNKNFERKAFFDKKWPDSKGNNNKGSLMLRSGALRNSISAHNHDLSITWTSSLPYAAIHNEGGQITVTQKMKNYFWYKYIEVTKGGKENTSHEAQFYKAMALMKVGNKITIPERRFIGFQHPAVNKAVKGVTDDFMKNLAHDLMSNLMI